VSLSPSNARPADQRNSIGADSRRQIRRSRALNKLEKELMTFSDLKLHPNLMRGVKELGFTRPTPIQSDAIPPALDGRDVLACAST
jgi:superfamily II DNA/RNA helicase